MTVKEALKGIDISRYPRGKRLYMERLYDKKLEETPPMMQGWINQLRVKAGKEPANNP